VGSIPGAFPDYPLDDLAPSGQQARPDSAQRNRAPTGTAQVPGHAGRLADIPKTASGLRIDARNPPSQTWGLNPFRETSRLDCVDPLDGVAAMRSALPRQSPDRAAAGQGAPGAGGVVGALKPSNLAAAAGSAFAAAGSAVGGALGAAGSALGHAAASLLVASPASVDRQLRGLQRSVISADFRYPQAGARSAAQLAHLTTRRNPIRAFWTHAALGPAAERPSPALLAELDRLAAAGDEHRLLALGLSLAFHAVQGGERDGAVQSGAVAWLAEPGLTDNALRWIGSLQSGPARATSRSEALALNVLGRVACGNQFVDTLRMLGHPLEMFGDENGMDDRKLDTFRTLMQAYATAHGVAPGGEARPHASHASHASPAAPPDEERGDPQREFARNVMRACMHRLAVDDDSALSPVEKRDIWVWQNDLRDQSPGGNLAQAKQFLSMLAEEFGAEDTAHTVLAGAKYGLGGADLRTLKEEAADLEALAGTPAVGALVADLGTALTARLESVRDEDGGADGDPERAHLIAQLVALEVWSPAGRDERGFELNDIVNGRGFDLSNPNHAEVRQLDHYCRLALAAASLAEGERTSLALANDDHRVAGLRTMAGEALSRVRMNLSWLGRLARDNGIGGDELEAALRNAERVMTGQTASPPSDAADDAVELISDFFANVQFGNNVTFYGKSETHGVSLRGTAVNVAAYIGRDDSEPLIVRANPLSVDRTSRRLLRCAAFTHGGEILFGVEQRGGASVGGGLQGGRNWAPARLFGARIAGGGDAGYSRERAEVHGIALRSLRNVSAMQLDASPPTFRHDDAAVRDEMAGLATTIREHARRLIRERDEAQAAGRPFDVDIAEEMLRALADKGLTSSLSLGLVRIETHSHRAEAAALSGVSVSLGQRDGMRFGGGGSATGEWVINAEYRQADESGMVRVLNHRDGSYKRLRTGTAASTNVFVGAAGLPPSDLASVSTVVAEVGANAKVRWIVDKWGKLVPRFCFRDAEFPDAASYLGYLHAHRDEWVAEFRVKYDGEPDAQAKAEQDFEDHVRLVSTVRTGSEVSGNHVNYARGRLYPQFAAAIDRFRAIRDLLPAGMDTLGAELEQVIASLSESPSATHLVSGITYAPQSREQGIGQSIAGVRGKRAEGMSSEREIVFDTYGWPHMARRERDLGVGIDASGKVFDKRGDAPAARPDR